MEEGTIFQGQKAPQAERVEEVKIPEVNPAPGQIYKETVAESLVSPPPSNPESQENDKPKKFNFKKLLIILVAAFAFICVLLLMIVFIKSLSSKPSDENVTLSYWGVNEDEKIMNSIITDFQKENPKIKIEYVKQDKKGYREKLEVRMKNGSGPDIFGFHNTWYPMFKNILSPLPKEVIDKSEFQNTYYNVAQKDLIKDGSIYGIPLGIDTLVMYVNTDILNQAGSEQETTFSIPETWQEFIDTSAKLTKRDENGKIDVSGGGIGAYENINHAPDIISLLFLQNGIDMNDFSKSPEKINDALQFYTNFAQVENNIWDETLDNSLTAFSKGKLAIYFGYADDYLAIKKLNPDLAFEIAPVPQLLKDSPINMASYWAEGVSSNSPYQKQAFLFMRYLTIPDVQEKLYDGNSSNNLSVRPYANKSLGERLKETQFYPIIQQANTAFSSPFVDNTFDNGLNDNLDSSLKGLVNEILSNSSVNSASSELSKNYADELNKYILEPSR